MRKKKLSSSFLIPSSSFFLVIIFSLNFFPICNSTSIDTTCLDQLCQLESGCNKNEKCLGSGSAHCGPYHLSNLYWKSAGKPGSDFDTCIFDLDCSRTTVSNYMDRFARDCDGDNKVTCIDVIAIQKAGPKHCHEGWVFETPYFKRFMALEGFALGTPYHGDHGTDSEGDHVPEETFFNETRLTTESNSLDFRVRDNRNPRRDERFRPTRNPRRPYTIVYWPVDDPRLVTEAPRRNTRKPWIISVGERNPTSVKPTRAPTTVPTSGDVPTVTRRRSRPRSNTRTTVRPTRAMSTRRSRTTERPRSSTSVWTTRSVTVPTSVSSATPTTAIVPMTTSTTEVYYAPTSAIPRSTTTTTTTTTVRTTTSTRPPPTTTMISTTTLRPVFSPRIAPTSTTTVPSTTRSRTKPTFNPTRTPKVTTTTTSTTAMPPTDWTDTEITTTPRKPPVTSNAPNDTAGTKIEIVPFKESCLECICMASSGCNYGNKYCDGKEGECGPFRIDYAYWYEAGYPGYEGNEADFKKCVQSRDCAETTVKAYVARYAKDCNEDGIIDCIDYASLHKGGPEECTKNWIYESKFWTTFSDCHGFDFRRKRRKK